MTTIDDSVTVRSGSSPDPLVLLLHGYGSNEQDLPGLMAHLPAGLAWASVRAPLTIGPDSYAWVPIGVPGRPDPGIVESSTRALLAWLEENVAPGRAIVLLGFSQGGLMVIQLLRADPERFVAGIVLSGFVLDNGVVSTDELAMSGVPVFFGHGDADQVIAPDATDRASRWLANHTDLTERTYRGLAHGICAEELDDVALFLRAEVV